MVTSRDPVEELLRIAGPPISGVAARFSPPILDTAGIRGGELLRLLRFRNGFYAFESALHVMPTGGSGASPEIAQWNSETLWRAEYGDLTKGCLFFAEDMFGNQFCVKDGEIQLFDAETADREAIAGDVRDWARKVMDDYNTMTGYPLGHKWQAIHGPLEPGKRLLPKVPFVTGGEYSVPNLYAGDAAEGMRFRGHVARKIHDLPDGARVEFKITP